MTYFFKSQSASGRRESNGQRWFRRLTGIALCAAVSFAVLQAVILLGRPFDRTMISEQTAVPAVVAVDEAPVLRSQSCSNASCHGALTPDDHPSRIRSDEYFVWLQDPHAQAGQTLSGEQSRAIFERLGVGDELTEPLTKRSEEFNSHWSNCLACHATSGTFQSEGVSCESCHGQSDQWLHQHYRKSWATLGGYQKRLQGFVPVDQVAVRTRQCSECHVGSQRGEVNHDLLAAGHPALRFEPGWYESRLPKHWKSHRRAARQQAGDEPAQQNAGRRPSWDWLIGQIVMAQASLEQLERRASDAGSMPLKGTWPELAEFDCFACHHDLADKSWRRDRRLAKTGRVSIPWGNWNLNFLPLVIEQWPTNDAAAFCRDVEALRQRLEQGHVSDRNPELVSQIKSTQRHLSRLLEDAAALSDRQAAELLQRTLQHDTDKVLQSWDRTANAILGAAAAHRDLPSEPLQAAMQRVRFPLQPEILESPRQFRSPEDEPPVTAESWKDLLTRLSELGPAQ